MQEILTQKFNRRDAGLRRFAGKKRDSRQGKLARSKNFIFSSLFPVHLVILAVSFVFISCRSKPADMRTVAPAETLIYLETKDLGRALAALTENKAFEELAKNRPDFSMLEGIQVGIAVTGFETSEKQLTDENAVLNFKPHFVAVADTHAWEWQARSFAENQLGRFVKENYGGESELKISDKNGGKWFEWTAQDKRKVFAFVRNSEIFFGNDETSIEKCLAVKRGEADNILKNEAFNRAYSQNAENNLAFGYVSVEGIAQIANLTGISVAVDATENEDGKSFIARVLPPILRNSIRDVTWTAQKSERGIEDKLSIALTPETVSVVKETLVPAAENQMNSAGFLPADLFAATHYNLKNPLVAWRSLLLLSAKNTDAMSGKMIVQFSASLLEPYGVADAEMFLSAIDSDILTAKLDAEGEKSIAVLTVRDKEKVKQSLTKEINFKASPEMQFNAEIWHTEDKLLSAAFVENKLILGDAQSVLQSLQAKQIERNFSKNDNFQKFAESRAVAVTFGKDIDSADKIVNVLGEIKDENKRAITNYMTETQVTDKGFERKSISRFGLIGTILEQFEE